jgi:hypothetical protein
MLTFFCLPSWRSTANDCLYFLHTPTPTFTVQKKIGADCTHPYQHNHCTWKEKQLRLTQPSHSKLLQSNLPETGHPGKKKSVAVYVIQMGVKDGFDCMNYSTSPLFCLHCVGQKDTLNPASSRRSSRKVNNFKVLEPTNDENFCLLTL